MTVRRYDGERREKGVLRVLHSRQTTMVKIKLMQARIFLENVRTVIKHLIGARIEFSLET
jgi:hypothetical protein